MRQPYQRVSNCPHCLVDVSKMNRSDVANHIRWCCRTNRELTTREIDEVNKHISSRFNLKRIACLLQIPIKLLRKARLENMILPSPKMTFTKESKLKISKARIKYLSENPDLHPWKRTTNSKSFPCERVKKHLIERGISFVEEVQPLVNRGFSIDIAFPDIKVGIEINGNQHYTEGKLSRYYQDRHNLITAAGWILHEVPARLVLKDLSIIDNILLNGSVSDPPSKRQHCNGTM